MGKSRKTQMFWIQSMKTTNMPLRSGSPLSFQGNPATPTMPPHPHTVSLMNALAPQPGSSDHLPENHSQGSVAQIAPFFSKAHQII